MITISKITEFNLCQKTLDYIIGELKHIEPERTQTARKIINTILIQQETK